MNYLNRFKQISDEAAEALQGLVSDMINKNTTNILEVGTYAGQVTLRLAGAAASKSPSVRVNSIDENHDSFSPTAEESLKASNLFNNETTIFRVGINSDSLKDTDLIRQIQEQGGTTLQS